MGEDTSLKKIKKSTKNLTRLYLYFDLLLSQVSRDSNYISIKRDSNYIGSGTIHRKGHEDDEAENAE